jgi:hypothetical protein
MVVIPFALPDSSPSHSEHHRHDSINGRRIKLYNSITAPLVIKFDCSSGKVIWFLEEIKQKADRIGCNMNLMVISNEHPVACSQRSGPTVAPPHANQHPEHQVSSYC